MRCAVGQSMIALSGCRCIALQLARGLCPACWEQLRSTDLFTEALAVLQGATCASPSHATR